jgi:hypothetical protein
VFGWLLLYGMPQRLRGPVWKEIRKWLKVLTVVAGVFLLIGLTQLILGGIQW